MQTKKLRPLGVKFLVSASIALTLGCAHEQTVKESSNVNVKHEAGRPPVAPVREVMDHYFGTVVVDPYRWMEDARSPELRSWLVAQDAYARDVLGGLPFAAQLVHRVRALSASVHAIHDLSLSAQGIFFLDREPGRQKPTLRVKTKGSGDPRILVDIEGSGATSFDYMTPSPNGRYVAYGLSSDGTEASVLHVLDVSTGGEVIEPVTRCRDALVSWVQDESAFFYSREPERPANAAPREGYSNAWVYLHRIGEPVANDSVIFGAGMPGSAFADEFMESQIFVDTASSRMLAVSNHAVKDNFILAVAPFRRIRGAPLWHQIAGPDDAIRRAAFYDGSVYVITSKGAPKHRLERWQVDDRGISRRTVVYESSTSVLRELAVARNGVYVSTLDAPERAGLLFFPHGDGAASRVALPLEGTLRDLTASPTVDGAAFGLESWIDPPRWFVHEGGPVTETGVKIGNVGRLQDVVVDHVEAKSHDGVMVPYSIVYRKGLVRDGRNPTWLQAYGSYGISLDPYFNPIREAWLERGGVVAFAHVRGGGEYGEPWHTAGQKRQKENSIRDLIACAQDLIRDGIATPASLGLFGASAGGIVAHGAVVRRPDLFGAVVVNVGTGNMLRLEQQEGGPMNAQEFGSLATEDGFQSLYAMDAYQRIEKGVSYPAMLLAAGMNDVRVPVWESAKFAARYQRATSSNRPILLRVGMDEGHGVGETQEQEAARMASFYSFFLWRLGERP